MLAKSQVNFIIFQLCRTPRIAVVWRTGLNAVNPRRNNTKI